MRKRYLLLLAAGLILINCQAQIANPGFESQTGSLPENWNIKKVDGYTINVTSAEKHSGQKALHISNNTGAGNFQSFSQTIAISVQDIDNIALNVYVKLKDVKNNIALWCQLWDSTGKQIGFYNSGQNGVLNGTSDWQELKMKMVADKHVKKLFFGGYLNGSGEVWFDDFSLEKDTLTNSPPNEEAISYVKKFTEIIEKNALYKDSLNWEEIKPVMQKLLKGAKSIEDTRGATNYLLGALRKAGDKHSLFFNKKVTSDYKQGNTFSDNPKSLVMDKNVGYIYVPAFGSINSAAGKAFTDTIKTLISNIDNNHNISGWIVDLRQNGGGNMWPMLAGLKSLVGERTPGYFVKGKNRSAWRISGKPMKLKNAHPKIAVLIGPNTASSGEMTAVAFIGKKNVKLFGSPSAGYTTANSTFYLPDGAMLALATSTVADRNKKVYLDKIIPDNEIAETSKKDNRDLTIDAAIKWINEKSIN
jgi:hypothetical protein